MTHPTRISLPNAILLPSPSNHFIFHVPQETTNQDDLPLPVNMTHLDFHLLNVLLYSEAFSSRSRIFDQIISRGHALEKGRSTAVIFYMEGGNPAAVDKGKIERPLSHLGIGPWFNVVRR